MKIDTLDTLMPSHRTQLNPLAQRLARAKRAYTTRHVPLAKLARLYHGDGRLQPRAGDLVLARVERIGKHAQLEQTDSRRSALFVGDEIVVAYGARYAPDQFEAVVPDALGPCHLVAGGGVAGAVTARHAAVAAATEIVPIGLFGDASGQRVNLLQYRLQHLPQHGARPVTIASVGTSMNAGKTTSAAYLIRGLTRAGLRVGAAKITGTGSGNDPGLLRDAGAVSVLDFTDAGHASTSRLGLDELEDILERLMSNLRTQQLGAIVLEVADGLFQRETAELLGSPRLRQAVDGVLFSSGDAMGASAGTQWLREHGLPVLSLCGTLTRSPLARREARDATQLPVMGLDELGDPQIARGLIDAAHAGRAPAAALAA